MTITELYGDYNDNLKPLLILVETWLNQFPIGILNEVRAFNDHIARTYEAGVTPGDSTRELDGAARHVLRAKLDCYKVLCTLSEDRVTQFRQDYRRVRLAETDSGRFLPEFTRQLIGARALHEQAKTSEKAGGRMGNHTLEKYEAALNAYGDLRQFLATQANNLAWSSSNQRKIAWGERSIGAGIAVIAGLLWRAMACWFGWR